MSNSILKPGLNYIFCHEDLELAFEKNLLDNITNDWNNGGNIYDISKRYKRKSDEVFLALFHQARAGKIKRKMVVMNYKECMK